MQFFLLAGSICVGIFFGVISIFVALSVWKPGPSRFFLILFIGSLISYPALVLSMILGVEYFNVLTWRGQELIYGVSFWIGLVYPVWLGVNLLLFVTSYRNSISSTEKKNEEMVPARRWEVPTQHDALIKILRRREWAFLVECLLVFGSLMLVFFAFNPMTGIDLEMKFAAFFFWSIGIAVLGGVRDGLGGVSLGKSLFGLRVVNDKTGAPIGFPKSFQRNWIYLIPFFAIVELAYASTRSDKRRIGDRIAGTVVVYGPPQFREGYRVQESVDEVVVAEKADVPNPFE